MLSVFFFTKTLGKIYNSVLLFHLNEFLIEKNFDPQFTLSHSPSFLLKFLIVKTDFNLSFLWFRFSSFQFNIFFYNFRNWLANSQILSLDSLGISTQCWHRAPLWARATKNVKKPQNQMWESCRKVKIFA